MSKKVIRPAFSWTVQLHDFNTDDVRLHDVLANRETLVKKLKKKCVTKEEFAEALNKDFMRQYWSRCEYEMILYIEDNRVYLEPWVGKFEEGRVDITEDTSLNWPVFAQKLLEYSRTDKVTGRKYAKFDAYDQLKFRFDELIDFVWTYKHKYERRLDNESKNQT